MYSEKKVVYVGFGTICSFRSTRGLGTYALRIRGVLLYFLGLKMIRSTIILCPIKNGLRHSSGFRDMCTLVLVTDYITGRVSSWQQCQSLE